jgi:TatD DNase family protein
MILLDTHCHLDAYSDPLAVVVAARSANVDLVAVTESPDSFRRFRTRLGRTPGVSVALGLHPGSTIASAPGQLQRFFRMLPNADWIGEIGLDFNSRVDARDRRAQYANFSSIVDHELARTLPMTIHSRGAAADVVAVLGGTGVQAILHWFTGTAKQAARAAEAGLWFSVNSAMVRSKSGASVLAAVPRDRLLLETDGPYCSHRGRPAEPKDLHDVVEQLAHVLGMLPADTLGHVAANTDRFVARLGERNYAPESSGGSTVSRSTDP